MNVTDYFKEWGSICRIFNSKENPVIHNHATLLQFAEDYLSNEIPQIAPLVVHQRLCHELVKIAKNNKGKKLSDVSDFTDMIKAIDVLEGVHPELKTEK